MAERVAAPLQVIPAALASLGLGFGLQKPRRRMPVAGAVALGMALTMALWAISVIAHAVAMSGALPPWLAGAIPGALSVAVAAAALRRG